MTTTNPIDINRTEENVDGSFNVGPNGAIGGPNDPNHANPRGASMDDMVNDESQQDQRMEDPPTMQTLREDLIANAHTLDDMDLPWEESLDTERLLKELVYQIEQKNLYQNRYRTTEASAKRMQIQIDHAIRLNMELDPPSANVTEEDHRKLMLAVEGPGRARLHCPISPSNGKW